MAAQPADQHIAVIGPKATATAVEVIEYASTSVSINALHHRSHGRAGGTGQRARRIPPHRRTLYVYGRLASPEAHRADLPLHLAAGQGGPNMPFYGRPADCDLVRATGNPVFEYEGEDFTVTIPLNGCVPQLNAVHGLPLFNNPLRAERWQPSLTVAAARYNESDGQRLGAGGPVFCAANAADGTE